MNSKILAPVLLTLSAAPAAFAFPVVVPKGSSGRPTTIVTTIAKGVAAPVTTVTTIVTGNTTPATIVGKVAKAINSPTTFIVETLTNSITTNSVTDSMSPAPFTVNGGIAPTATYVPPASDDAMEKAGASNQMPQKAESKAEESNDHTMIVEEQPMFRTTDTCDKVSVKSIDFVTIPSRDTSLKNDQATVTAVNGTMALYPKANGKFIRRKLFDKNAFVVSFEGRWFNHRKTFHLDEDAIIYQGDRLTKVDFLERGDPVEVAFVESNDTYVAVAVESNRTGEYVASR
jgi:hypothetical protein